MNAKRLYTEMNIVPLAKEVMYRHHDFLIDTARQKNIPVQSETMTINLIRGITFGDIHLNDSDRVELTEHSKKYRNCFSFLDWFKSVYGGTLYRVAIVLLPPEKQVYPHIDFGSYYANKDRFHLVLNGIYDMIVDGERFRFEMGDLWWFDNKKTHSVINLSDTPRLSIIFDVEGCKW